jgi:hypothetical protein
MTTNPPGPDDGRADRGPPTEPLHELTLGRQRSSPDEAKAPRDSTSPEESTDADLDETEARCRLKAEAARWAAECQHRIREGTGFRVEDAPLNREVIAYAEMLADSFYWMSTSAASQSGDITVLDDLGGCYEAVAEALRLVGQVLAIERGNSKVLERTLPLLAEAQSGLREALRRLQAPEDPDQLQAFEWLKATAARHRVYLKRFMRADDPADPGRWSDLLTRIESEQARRGQAGRPSIRGSPTDRLRALLKLIREDAGTELDWQAVFESVDELIGAGVPPSDREVRELLLPVIHDLPDRDDLPDGFRLVLREIDRFLATRKPPSGAAIAHEPTAEVKEARRLLGGRSVVLIGGICRREAQAALKTALGLKELTWIETREHQSIGAFEPAVARPDVALVVLAIRWSSHSFGDVKQFCDRHGKPLVRLPGGYSPNQVAAQILAQCSEQLAGE